jgi:hypothetical protein
MHRLSDATFANLSPNPAVDKTIAYWCFWGKSLDALLRFDVDTLWLKAASQYSAEGQASVGDEDIWGDPNLKKRITLFAPIQLAQSWSPLPYLEQRLGDPDRLVITEKKPKAVFAIWKQPQSGPGSNPISSNERSAERLLAVATSQNRPLGCICFAGFSYSTRKLSNIAQSALAKAGLLITTRAIE